MSEEAKARRDAAYAHAAAAAAKKAEEEAAAKEVARAQGHEERRK